MSGELGVGWRAGNPQEARKVLAKLHPLIRSGMDATPGDTASWELLRTAAWWVESMIQDLTDAALDETHMADSAGTLLPLLLGAKCVPDAVLDANIDSALRVACEELLPHLTDEMSKLSAPAVFSSYSGVARLQLRSQ